MNDQHILILVNGEFPTHGVPLSLLASERPLLCTDGAVTGLLARGISPDFVLGDMDSRPATLPDAITIISLTDQSDSDFEKALRWCREQHYAAVTILGISGKREDHQMANFLALLPWCSSLAIRCVTDTAIVVPLFGAMDIPVTAGQTVSLLAPEKDTLIATSGLRWNLENETLTSPTRGISNIAEQEFISIAADHPMLVFLLHPDYHG